MRQRIVGLTDRRALALASVLVGALLVFVVLRARRSEPPMLSPPVETSPTPMAAVPLSSLALPNGCLPFDKGHWERPVEAGVAEAIRLTTSSCAIVTLDALAQSGRGIEVTWTILALGGASPVARAVLTWPYDASATGERNWTGTVTFPEPGQWVADPRLGGGVFFDVTARDAGLVQRSPNLPLPAAPQTVAVLDGEATKVLRTFPGERGGLGMLRNPDRAIFVQARDGGRWIAAGDVATGVVTPLFEVGAFAFTTIDSAPDGRAAAVQWALPNGKRELRIVTAASKVTVIDDGTINPFVIAWAPDSSTLLAEGDSLWVFEPDGAVRHRRPSPEPGGAQIAWSPDSKYALLWYQGQRSKLMRLDLASFQEEPVVTDVALASVAVAPNGREIALAWRRDADGTTALALVPSDRVVGVRLDDFLVADAGGGLPSGIGGLIWSPDGRFLAFSGSNFVSHTGVSPGSEMRVLDVSTGAVRAVAEARGADAFYAGQARLRSWSADSSLLFALRYNCQGCGPSSSSVDVIDVIAGRVIETFESAGFYGPTAGGEAQLLSTPDGVVRTDGRRPAEVLISFPGGLFFGAGVIRVTGGEPLLAVDFGLGRGQQIFAAPRDGSKVDPLGTLPLNEPPAALVDQATAVVRGDGRWERRALRGGAAEPYVASGGAREKWDFALSPSGRLALDFDREAFAVLDATNPAAPAVVPRRPNPGGVVGHPAWSTDERRVALGDVAPSSGYAITVFDIASGAERVFELDALGAGLTRDEPRDWLWALGWTPGGAIDFATQRALWRLDVEAGAAIKVAEAPRPGGFTQGTVLTYAPDGRSLVAATQFGVFLLRGSSWTQLSAVGVSPAGGVLYWAPDSTAVAFAGMTSHIPEGVIVAPLDGSGAYRLVAPGAGRVLGWLGDGRIVWVSVIGGT